MKSRGVVIAIGVFKLAKAALLAAGAVGLFELAGTDATAAVARWTKALGLDPSAGVLRPVFARLGDASPHELGLAGIGTVVYALLFLVEGIGLLRGKRWGEYLTIAITSSFLPFEIYEAVAHASIAKVAVLVVNAAIVVYLVARVRSTKQRGDHAEGRGAAFATAARMSRNVASTNSMRSVARS